MTGENDKQVPGRDHEAGKKGNGPTLFTVAIVIVIVMTLCVGAYMVINAGNPDPQPGAGNETQVPGHPELFEKRIGIFYENGTQISILENRDARDPVYGQLLSFLMDDPTEHCVYQPGYECSSFAVNLHDQAEICNIRAYIVLVWLSKAPLHMIVGFNTTDNGMVYVDDTGLTQDEIDHYALVADRTVNLTIGAPYIRHFLPPFDSDEDPGMGTVTDFAIIGQGSGSPATK